LKLCTYSLDTTYIYLELHFTSFSVLYVFMGYNLYQYNSPLYVSDKLKLVTVKGVLDGGGEG